MRIQVDAVLDLLQARASTLSAETINLADAAGRVLAASIISPVNIPRFARTAMDGFAVRAEDTSGASATTPRILTLVGSATPARAFAGTVGPGEAVAVATGAPIPAGADAVVVSEAAEAAPGGCIAIRASAATGRHIVRIGEDIQAGREVVPSGRRLRPQDLGVLASVGANTIAVYRRPRVAILVTGNEILPPGSPLRGSAIHDSNSPMLRALVARDGGVCTAVHYVPDDLEAIRSAILAASEHADTILATGGSSVGAEDHTPRVAAELGELVVHGVAMRPGSPMGIAILPRRTPVGPDLPLFLLPGNPVACLCAYDLFAGRVVRRFGGRPWELPYRKIALPLAAMVASAAGRTDCVRVKVSPDGALPLSTGGAGNLSTTVVADGFILIGSEREALAVGESVDVWLYDESSGDHVS